MRSTCDYENVLFYVASPTCVVWWESMDDRHICITGSEVGFCAMSGVGWLL